MCYNKNIYFLKGLTVMNLIDCHTHTQYSVDSEADINLMIERACNLELAAYAITDHCECNRWYSESYYKDATTYRYFDFGQDFENSVSAVTELKEKYRGKLNLICGVELGQATQEFDVAEKVVSDKRLDFVIGSVHQVPDTEDFAFLDYSSMDWKAMYELMQTYMFEINKLCKWGKFDVLGHLTYFLRYFQNHWNLKFDISTFDDIIEESFRELIAKGKGIEINTSGLRNPKIKETFPSLKYLQMFRKLGGEIISIGSDAHTVEDLGTGTFEGIKLAEEAGFRYIAYFKERKPNFIKI